MSALLKLGSAVFGGSLTSLSLFKKQSFAETSFGPPRSPCRPSSSSSEHPLVTPASESWHWNWDGRQNNPGCYSGVRNIFFIRHGEYETEARVAQLTDRGVKQARMLGTFLKKFADKEFPNLRDMDVRCYHSGVLRAEQTCSEAMKVCSGLDLKPRLENRLAEGWPMYPSPSFEGALPCNQEVVQCRNRLNSFFQERMHRSSCNQDTFELYFCHGNVARFLTLKLLQMPLLAWSRFIIGHCGITWIRIFPDGRVSCLTYGDTGFLDSMDMITS